MDTSFGKTNYFCYTKLLWFEQFRALHYLNPTPQLLPKERTEQTLPFEKLISRRRKPNIIYSDNAKTFKGTLIQI